MSVSVSEGVSYVYFLVYLLFNKNVIICVAAFILDKGRVNFGRGVYQFRVF